MGTTVFYLLMLQKYISSEIKKYTLCLENISGTFSPNNMKKTGLNGCVYNFSVDDETFDITNIIDIHKYLMKKHDTQSNL